MYCCLIIFVQIVNNAMICMYKTVVGGVSHTHRRPLVGTFFCIVLYYFVQAAVSVIRNSEVVRYSGAATVLNILWRYRLVHIAVSVIW